MLKFKEIKKSIIHTGEHDASPIASSKKYFDLNHQISFKTIKQFQQYSPLNKKQLNDGFHHKFDTDKKSNIIPTLNEFNIKSQSKENNPQSIYYNRATKFTSNDIDNKKLQFGHKKRKISNVPSQYNQKSYQNSASKNNNNLSFANLLQSKRVETNSKKKNYLQSDRKNQRQSSISKLKQKLFSMKKVIAQKQKPQLNVNRFDTQRHLNTGFEAQKSIYKGCRLNLQNQDLVKISIKNDQPSFRQLDMAPFF